MLRRREVLLESFSQRSAENARRAKDLLLMYQNARKARLGGLDGLQDPAVMDRKRAEEKALLAAAAKQSAAGRRLRHGHRRPSTSRWRPGRSIRDDYDLLERGQAFYSELFVIARTLVRLAEETAKPNADRLREYRESNLDSLKQELFSPAPIYDDLQTALLADSLSMYLERKGGDNRLVAGGDGGQVAPAAGGRVGRRHQAGRRGGAPQTGRGRHGGHRGLGRPDDPAGPAGRQAGPQGPHRTTSSRSRSRSAGPMASWPAPASRCSAPRPIPTPRSRCGWRSAW